MENVTTVPLVHFYDTHLRRILCGVGFEHRSTKHSRQVTCQACIGLLGTRPSSADVNKGFEAGGDAASP